ncbi:peptidoglycan-binding protein, partial [Candidatus Nomurabacteria bacterium]|nr:peptidoglycan-binding protein [Candidatus Nomurabacteria bacterium]
MIKKSSFAKFAAGFVALATILTASSASAAYNFTTTLKQGSRGAAVMELQKALNMCADTQVAASGVGSMGMETSTFGPATKAAVMKFQAKHGITPVAGLFGPLTRAKMNATGCGTTVSTTLPAGCTSTVGFSPITGASCATGTVAPQTGSVIASLATTNPASSTLVGGQATANLAQFTFTGTGTVTNVTLQRIGVSADSTLSNVYLFDGAMRLTDAATVSNNGMVTFSNGAGLFMVNGSKTISVKSDIASVNGETVGVKLVSFMTAGSSANTVNISGNLHSVASATLASVTHGTVTPSGATINPGSAVTVWQSTLNISQRDVMMKRLAVRQVGSAPSSAFANFKLFVNGAQVASATGMDSLGYVTFDMTNAPVTLMSGSRVVRIDADVLSGASRTMNFSVRQAADVDFVDSSYGVNITPTSTPWAGSASTIGGTSGGSVTVEKDTSSPTQPVSVGANDVKLGTFKVTAYGEAVKLETLRASFTTSDASVDSLRNGRITIGGVQYGSTATLMEDSSTPAYTSYTTNYVVYPGTPVMIDVYADMYDNDGTNNLSNGDTFAVNLETGSSNASKQDSLGYINVPGAQVVANTITANAASLTVAASPV